MVTGEQMLVAGVHVAAPGNVSEFAGERFSPPKRGTGIVVGRYIGASSISLTMQSFYRCFNRLVYSQDKIVIIGCCQNQILGARRLHEPGGKIRDAGRDGVSHVVWPDHRRLCRGCEKLHS